MKVLLACLMCLVLPISQIFAIDGGPVYGSHGQVRTTGNYAGILNPIPVSDGGTPPTTTTDNSLALFTLTVPQTGLASGTTVIFRNGIAYTGSIQGIADPDSAKLTGIVDGSYSIVLASSTSSTSSSETIAAQYNANGNIKGRIVQNPKAFSTAANRIRGKASLTYTYVVFFPSSTPYPDGNGGSISYKISGFKQSEAGQ